VLNRALRAKTSGADDCPTPVSSSPISGTENRAAESPAAGERRLLANDGLSEGPWTLTPDPTTTPNSRSASPKESAEGVKFEASRVPTNGSLQRSSRSTPTEAPHYGDKRIHPLVAPPLSPADKEGSEEPWTLNRDNNNSGSPTSAIGNERSISGSFQRSAILDHMSNDKFNADDPASFGLFAISMHKNNLIIELREEPTLLSRFRLRPKKESPHASRFYTRPEPRSYRISLAELQRIHLRKLQCKCVKHVVDMRFRNIEPPNWEADLEAYSKHLPLVLCPGQPS